MPEQYESTHPWINFQATDINRVPPNNWMLLGEAKSKCQHLAGAPLKPAVAQDLYRVTLVKGALATTAIEGNTLTEDQANGILDGTYAAPPSRQYQEQEVRNVLEALQELNDQIVRGERIELTTQLVKDFNLQVLKGLPLPTMSGPARSGKTPSASAITVRRAGRRLRVSARPPGRLAQQPDVRARRP